MYFLLVAVLALFIFRFLGPPRFFIIAGIALLIFGVYYLFRYIRQRRQQKAFLKTTAGIIQSRLQYCETELALNREEINRIRQSINDLEDSSHSHPDLTPRNREDSEQLIRAFRSELKLRQSKVRFFQVCIQKLESLLHNHQLAEKIKAKKEELRRLQENHYEELAELEELKSSMEMDAYYLDTIETLSLKMPETTSLDDALRLQQELEEMTRELDEL